MHIQFCHHIRVCERPDQGSKYPFDLLLHSFINCGAQFVQVCGGRIGLGAKGAKWLMLALAAALSASGGGGSVLRAS